MPKEESGGLEYSLPGLSGSQTLDCVNVKGPYEITNLTLSREPREGIHLIQGYTATGLLAQTRHPS